MSETLDLSNLISSRLKKSKITVSIGDTIEHEFRFKDKGQIVKYRETLTVLGEEGEMFTLKNTDNTPQMFPVRSYSTDGTFKLPKEYISKYAKKIG
jgi:hypothetical protein